MNFLDIIFFLGGIGLFLYGIKIMGQGLESAAGNKMKNVLNKVTTNRFTAVIVGIIITALIQSSSATTAMTVGFVNSGLMSLSQAVGLIMGANIGTTITSVLVAMNLSEIAPLFVFSGAALIVLTKNRKINNIGEILSGFGLLFMGMNIMSDAMEPLRESELFINFMTKADNPIIGMLSGMICTAIIQSSSASIGILQALAFKDLVSLELAVYILFGQNIGTVITAFLSSIGTNINAKRTAVMHLLFNTAGTIFFMLICILSQKFLPYSYFELLKNIAPTNTAAQISAAHIIFNVVSTIILFPFSNSIVSLSCRIIPDKKDKINSKFLAKSC